MGHCTLHIATATLLRAALIGVCLGAAPAVARPATALLLDQAAGHVGDAAARAYPGGRVAVQMVPLDPRLTLTPCEDLSLEIPGGRVLGRVAVHARCRAPSPWQIYLTAQVEVELPVVVVTRPVPRDSVVRAGDVTLAEQDLAQLRDGYLTELDDVVGMSARTSLRADAVLYQRQLSAPRLVSRGDLVTLATVVGQVTVTTRAEALSDGVYGEQIEVRNPRSERVVSAWVTGAGRVSTRPAG